MSGVNKASTASERRKKKSGGENENGNVAADEKQTEEKCTLNSSKMAIANSFAVAVAQHLHTLTDFGLSLIVRWLLLFGCKHRKRHWCIFILSPCSEIVMQFSTHDEDVSMKWSTRDIFVFFLLLFVIPLPVAILWFSVCLQLMIALTRDIKTARAKRRHRQQQL